jgi:hypothetical protein
MVAIIPAFVALAAAAHASSSVDFTTGYSSEAWSPYNYPSPNITVDGAWQVAVGQAQRFIAQLTLEEKVGICTGNKLSK